VLIAWWLTSSVSWDSQWWNPFHSLNTGTVLFQWAIVLAVLILLNKVMYKRIFEREE
jgi:NSS family neurotransmitter:Na+ symporter